ncbi:type II secretion system F family protein [Aestuariimicrobium ganziense]|uniref:type II secretion system F family protein n=1 Tax=Aestuariimicrobium ganziense TaxID=2773677 RepID=UPI0019430DFD|nr:pilus assembly protein TadB [Aestuariimicrobium ganziense]
MEAVAVLAAGLAGWCWVRPPRRGVAVRSPASGGRGGRRHPVVVLVLAVGCVAVAALAGGPVGRWVATALVAMMTGSWLVASARRRAALTRTRTQVSDGCQSLSGQLRAGQVPGRALLVAAEDCPVMERAAASHRIGGDVPSALRAAAGAPGAEGLVALAAAWQLAEGSGAPIADLVDGVAEEQRDQQRLQGLVGSELAAARATGKMLAALPLVGVAMAAAVDADPAGFLLGTTLGQFCVLAAVALTSTGLVWTETIAERGAR